MARYGGEEFVFLAPSTGPDGAHSMAEKLVRAVEALALPHERSPLGHVSISVGIASMRNDGNSPAQRLVQRADAALYRAKAQGRNRVKCG